MTLLHNASTINYEDLYVRAMFMTSVLKKQKNDDHRENVIKTPRDVG